MYGSTHGSPRRGAGGRRRVSVASITGRPGLHGAPRVRAPAAMLASAWALWRVVERRDAREQPNRRGAQRLGDHRQRAKARQPVTSLHVRDHGDRDGRAPRQRLHRQPRCLAKGPDPLPEASLCCGDVVVHDVSVGGPHARLSHPRGTLRFCSEQKSDRRGNRDS